MEIIQTNKIIIEAFEKIGFTLQYVYQEPNDCEEISLSVELEEDALNSISLNNIATMCEYIDSETNNDRDTLIEFERILLAIEDNTHLFLVWE